MPDEIGDRGGTSSDSEEALVRAFIRRLVGEIAPAPSPEVRPGHILLDELGYDSVREVELTFALEEIFEFEPFVIEDSPVMRTVADLEDFTLDMIAQGRASVPTWSEVDGAGSLISTFARTS